MIDRITRSASIGVRIVILVVVLISLFLLLFLCLAGMLADVYFTSRARVAPSDRNLTIARTQVELLGQGIETYWLQNGRFPTESEGIGAVLSLYEASDVDSPPIDPWGHPYRYKQWSDCAKVWSLGPDTEDGTVDDIVLEIIPASGVQSNALVNPGRLSEE